MLDVVLSQKVDPSLLREINQLLANYQSVTYIYRMVYGKRDSFNDSNILKVECFDCLSDPRNFFKTHTIPHQQIQKPCP